MFRVGMHLHCLTNRQMKGFGWSVNPLPIWTENNKANNLWPIFSYFDRQDLPTRVKLESSRFSSTMEDDGPEHAEPRYVTAEQDAENHYTEAELENETRYLRIQQEQNIRYLEQVRAVQAEEASEEDLEDAAEQEGDEEVGEMERLPTMNGQVMMGGHNNLHHLEQEQPEDLSRE